MALAFFAALSNTWLNPSHFNGKLEVVEVRMRQVRNPSISSSPIHAADFKFNIQLGNIAIYTNIDVTPAFHWNTENEVTVWDRILLKSSKNYKINLSNLKSKYTLEDDGPGLL
ncbi:hypothetical protein HZS_3654 [Henneguya salminicola]|nr:hypothetical protein HZS_3654 [Henneguya salminicola]